MTSILKTFFENYNRETSSKLKVVDAFLVYQLATAVVQFVYCMLVGTFPFNSFLAGFISTIGSFVLTACLRIQANPKSGFTVSQERAFADFLFASLLLHLVVFNFIG